MREDGLLERKCGRCGWRGIGSAGQQCPSCRAWSEDYGPIYRGRIFVYTEDCRGKPETWTITREYVAPHIADELVREGFGSWRIARGEPLGLTSRWVHVVLGDPDRLPAE